MISMEREGNAARSRRPKLARSAATITMAPTRPSPRPTSISSPPAGPVTAASPTGWLGAVGAGPRDGGVVGRALPAGAQDVPHKMTAEEEEQDGIVDEGGFLRGEVERQGGRERG